MDFTIEKDVENRINWDRFKELLRRHGLQVSGTKLDLVNRVKAAAIGGQSTLTVRVLDEFIAEEISHGRNRMLFISSFPSSAVPVLKNLETVKESLSTNKLPTEYFNSIRTIQRPPETTLVYLNVSQNDAVVNKISMCFAKTSLMIGLRNEDGDDLPPRSETEYIWADIIPDEKRIIIKVRPRTGNSFESAAKTKELYDEISTIVREIFSLPPKSMEEVKNTLYKMFKDLTRTAEKPFRDRVEPLKNKIETFADECAKELGLPNAQYPIDLPYRLFRLLERALIQKDFALYQAFFDGKLGIVDRFAYSDPTGASVNARSGSEEEGIAVADIYFDTRDTIEERKMFDKLWVTWFDTNSIPTARISTKFEAYKEHFILHFLYAYTTKEVEDLVLSNIKHYESLPS